MLIISAEVWRDDTNGGNVLSNLFANSCYEFAQIYCSPGEPQNKLCKKYYQMTDSMMVNSILKKGKPGREISYNNNPSEDYVLSCKPEQDNNRLFEFIKRYRLASFFVLRSVIWNLGKWNNEELKSFILNFNPDIIFAPCYASHELLAIDRFAKSVIDVPVISYISDDNYGLKQFRLDPIYWLNRLVLRRNIRKTFPIYDLVYTMTDEQKQEYEQSLHCKMKVLKKGGDFANVPIKENVHSPIRLIYAGGIYCGRWKTLARIAEEIRKINKDSTKIVLDIFTGNQLTNKQKRLLDDGENCRVHAAISLDTLRDEYRASDIALHVESFELKYKLLTRLSFSTKIIDCMASGCAVMAICWKEHAGYKYLENNNIAICIDSLDGVKDVLNQIIVRPNMVVEYAQKTLIFGKRYHQIEDIQSGFRVDLESYITE